MKLQRKHLIAFGTVAVLAATIVVWRRPEPAQVETVVAQRAPFRVTLDEDGVTRIRRHAVIAAPVSGRVAESTVEAGDSVSVGTIVAQLTPAPLDARAREQAAADLRAAQSLRTAAQAYVAQARVALGESTRAHERAQRLAQSGGVSNRELEAAAADVETRRSELDAALARERAAEQDERRARSALLDADPGANRAHSTVVLRSPLAGRVLHVYQEHDRVVPAGTPLLEVGRPADLEIVVDVLTRDAPDISPGALMVVRSAGRTLAACVDHVEPAAFTKVSPLGVEEQRVNVVGRFSEPVTGLGDAFSLDVSIVLWESEAILAVPLTALVPVDSGWGVFLIENGKARLREIRVGHRGAHDTEVTDGLKGGDVVIVYPDERLRDGARVAAVKKAR